MKKLVLFISLAGLLASCQTFAPQPTATTAPTHTAVPTETATTVPTATLTATPTLTPVPTVALDDFIQNLAAKYVSNTLDPTIPNIEWDYIHKEDYGDTGVCLIYYSPETDVEVGTMLLCTNIATPKFDPIAAVQSLAKDWVTLESGLEYEGFGSVNLVANENSSDSTTYISSLPIGNDMLSVQINFNNKLSSPLQEYFDKNLHELLDNSYQKALADGLDTTPVVAPTVSAEEQKLIDTFGPTLISEEFLHTILDEDWKLDYVHGGYRDGNVKMPGVCSNHTSSLRNIGNCINFVGPDFKINSLAKEYPQDSIHIQPRSTFPNDVAFFGYWDGNSWVIQGYLLVDGYLLFAHLDGIHIGVGTPIDETLASYVDDYVGKILLENLTRLPQK